MNTKYSTAQEILKEQLTCASRPRTIQSEASVLGSQNQVEMDKI